MNLDAAILSLLADLQADKAALLRRVAELEAVCVQQQGEIGELKAAQSPAPKAETP